jgi:hypothetical protein
MLAACVLLLQLLSSTPSIRPQPTLGHTDRYELILPPHAPVPTIEIDGADADLIAPDPTLQGRQPWLIRITPRPGDTVARYTATVQVGPRWSRPIRGTLLRTTWRVRAAAWTINPRTDPEAWHAETAKAPETWLTTLDLPFALEGPAAVSPVLPITQPDRFGLIATTTIDLPPGRWRIRARADDGLRLRVNHTLLIDRWNDLATSESTAEFTATDQPTTIDLDYFEHSGHAELRVELEPAD